MILLGMVAYEFERLADWEDPRQAWGIGVGVLLLLGAWTWRRYRRELPQNLLAAAILTLARLTAFAALALFLLGLVQRVDEEVVANSRILVAADVSQSMMIEDERNAEDLAIRRIDAVKALFDSRLLSQLHEEHDVVLGTFDAQWKAASHWRRGEAIPQMLSPDAASPDAASPDAASPAAAEPGAASPDADLANGSAPLNAANGANAQADGPPGTTSTGLTVPASPGEGASARWQDALRPQGTETRIGDVVAEALATQTPGGAPLAGVILVTDGGQNGGLDPLDAARRAAAARTPLVTIGVGSTEPRRNARVHELIAPSRGYPNDKAPVRVLLGAEGMEGRSAKVDLYVTELKGGDVGVQSRVSSETVVLPAPGQLATVEFQIAPSSVGRLEWEARLADLVDDQYAADNSRTAETEIVESSLRVLLVAGAAMRDYQFLRNQLHRDPHVQVDVLLQLSPPGVSQDCDAILASFPSAKEALFGYDAIVGFDPDWARLDAQQVDLLEQWVAEEAGGLIVVAGPVHTPGWVQSVEHQKLRALYPVEFQRRLTLLDDGLYGSKTPWPIEFTRAGEEADFLRLKPSPDESRELWRQFRGVHGCYAVKGPKPGAVVLGRFGDPDAGLGVDRPVYLAEQFYGAGRVFYLGSGELWRLRGLDPALYETLTTQLLRHVSQGRLLRGSSRGRLLVERDRFTVGDSVVVRAQLSTLQREPLAAPQVTARVTGPEGAGSNVVLTADENRPGNFHGQFSVLREGTYRIELPVPEALDEQLTRRIQVSPPDREFAETQRQGELLAELARISGGRYYASWQDALADKTGDVPAGKLLESKAETTIVRGKPVESFTIWLHKWLLAAISGSLCLEWLTRRLLKLA